MSIKTTSLMHIRKRNGEIVLFDTKYIYNAISKAFDAIWDSDTEIIAIIVEKVHIQAQKKQEKKWSEPIAVEELQDIVENELMDSHHHEVAKEYILYRSNKAQKRKKNIFKKRIALKPYEYPELYDYVDAIRHSYWVHTEFNFTSDINDFHTNITPSEKNVIKNTMLAISQIEVAVKSFWWDIGKKLPKPEIAAVWQTFWESEVRHADAYSHLLELLWLNHEFEKIKDIPVLMKRVDYLEKAIKYAHTESKKDYTLSVLLFSLFIEHVSLFSQFLIMMAFNKHKNLFKWISNAVEATSKEEQIHGLFGIELINTIKKEQPGRFDDDFANIIKEQCQKAYEAEAEVVDRICEQWELDFLPTDIIKEFIKNRLNNSLVSIWYEKIFTIDREKVEQTDWFEAEILTTKHNDFFNKRSINYNKKSKSITADDLF